MLTKRQRDLLILLDERLRVDGISPSFDEMRESLGLRSKSGVHRLLGSLQERGFIRRLPHRARAIEVLRVPPKPVDVGFAPRARRTATNKVEGVPAGILKAQSPQLDERCRIPFYGRIAAGARIEAIADETEFIDVDSSMVGGTGSKHYALEVVGDSMVEAGIVDGDIAVIREDAAPPNGSIVVALIDNEETTLKRLRRKGNSIALEAANSAYKTQLYGVARVAIQGRMVAMIRRYQEGKRP
ncbi:MAG: transcriptional repressor LexA [Alphaproteobacteria bacterium GM202ARS2]|nr:transcriptional repressor LexA [Alphaproteobacteria bacterium GM202ARS2]